MGSWLIDPTKLEKYVWDLNQIQVPGRGVCGVNLFLCKDRDNSRGSQTRVSRAPLSDSRRIGFKERMKLLRAKANQAQIGYAGGLQGSYSDIRCVERRSIHSRFLSRVKEALEIAGSHRHYVKKGKQRCLLEL